MNRKREFIRDKKKYKKCWYCGKVATTATHGLCLRCQYETGIFLPDRFAENREIEIIDDEKDK